MAPVNFRGFFFFFLTGPSVPCEKYVTGLGTCPDLTLTGYIAFGKSLNDSEPQLSLLGQGY